jgi:hypothetical protein
MKLPELSLLKGLCSFSLILLCLWGSGAAEAGELSQHLENFPQWEKITSVRPAEGDLVYPDWMAGDWLLTSTLVDLVAPLAPDIVTPGFAGNRRQLNQAFKFPVRFIKIKPQIPRLNIIPRIDSKSEILVADRAFNSLNSLRAYLGDKAALAVKVDPKSPNRQIAFLGSESQLVSTITGRATETLSDQRFITTEVFQQLFKGGSRPYFNSVESTTAYKQLFPVITADQVSAVYLSPQDPNYFVAGSRPVALYRYRLEFSRQE